MNGACIHVLDTTFPNERYRLAECLRERGVNVRSITAYSQTVGEGDQWNIAIVRCMKGEQSV